MSINKELLNGDKLTKRAMQSQRARLAKLGSACANIIEGVLTRASHCEACKEEFNPGKTITKVDLDAIKLVYAKTMGDIKDEDFEKAADETKSREELAQDLADTVTHSNMIYINDLMKYQPNIAKQLKDYLNDSMGKVTTIESKTA